MKAGIYDSGGILQHGNVAVNLSGKPERVLNPRETVAYEAGHRGGAGPLINGDVHFHSVDGTPQAALEEMAWELRKIHRGGGFRR